MALLSGSPGPVVVERPSDSGTRIRGPVTMTRPAVSSFRVGTRIRA